jgi:hypothetical protein
MMSEDAEAETLDKLPLDAWHRDHGARMVGFAGYEMPIQYEGILAEHEWTRNHAGLFDVSHMGQLTVSGDGAVEGLEALLPADIASLRPGRIRYSLLLAEDGGIICPTRSRSTIWPSTPCWRCKGRRPPLPWAGSVSLQHSKACRSSTSSASCKPVPSTGTAARSA